MSIRCPKCRSTRIIFDSPTEEVYLSQESQELVLRSLRDDKKIRKTLRVITVLESQVKDESWVWSCKKCGEFIENPDKRWYRLEKIALRYLKSWI